MWSRAARVLGFCVLTCGCASLESITSGQVGCAESDIEITNDSPGWNSRTWTARCHDRTYFCTAVKTGKESSQVNCAEDNASARAAAAAQHEAPKAAPKPGAPGPPPAAPGTAAPPGAAGLNFGSDPAAAQAVCEGAGLAWSEAGENHFACSGLPKPVGVEARAISRFCNGKLCAIQLRVTAEGKWLNTYAKIASKLGDKYGEPQARKGSLPGQCLGDHSDEACINEGHPRISQTWKWPNGTRIRIQLDAEKAPPQLDVFYVQQQNEVTTDAL